MGKLNRSDPSLLNLLTISKRESFYLNQDAVVCCLQVQTKGKSEKESKDKAGMDLLVLPVLQNTYVGFVVRGSTRQLSFKSSTGSQVQFYVRTAAAYKPLSKTGSYVRSAGDRRKG